MGRKSLGRRVSFAADLEQTHYYEKVLRILRIAAARRTACCADSKPAPTTFVLLARQMLGRPAWNCFWKASKQ